MTIKDVARVANVSRYTVYRVLKNDPAITAATANKVRQAMKKIAYIPKVNKHLYDFKGKSANSITGNIAIMMLGVDYDMVRAPILMDLVNSAQEELVGHDFNVIYANLPTLGTLPPKVLKGEIDGILLYGVVEPHDIEIERQLKRYPTVWMLGAMESLFEWGDRVLSDNDQIGKLAARCLLEKNIKNVAFIDPLSHIEMSSVFSDRTTAFQNAMLKEGGQVYAIKVEGDFLKVERPIPYHLDAKYLPSLVEQLVHLPVLPEGLFLPSDLTTVHAYRLLMEQGITPGKDLTIVSCNNETSLLAGLKPRPASVDICVSQIGALAAKQLLWRIDNPDYQPTKTLVEAKLVYEHNG